MNITSRRGHGRLGLGRTGAALLVAACFALTGCSATSTEAAPSSVANAAEQSAELGPVLVTGTVSRDGQPLPDTPVFVQVWSDEEIEVGERVDMHDVGPVRTDEHGSYTIVLDRGDLAREYFVGEDIVNFDVMVTDPVIGPISTSAEWSEDESSWTYVGGGGGPKTMDFDLGTMKATETDGDGSTSRWPLTELR